MKFNHLPLISGAYKKPLIGLPLVALLYGLADFSKPPQSFPLSNQTDFSEVIQRQNAVRGAIEKLISIPQKEGKTIEIPTSYDFNLHSTESEFLEDCKELSRGNSTFYIIELIAQFRGYLDEIGIKHLIEASELGCEIGGVTVDEQGNQHIFLTPPKPYEMCDLDVELKGELEIEENILDPFEDIFPFEEGAVDLLKTCTNYYKDHTLRLIQEAGIDTIDLKNLEPLTDSGCLFRGVREVTEKGRTKLYAKFSAPEDFLECDQWQILLSSPMNESERLSWTHPGDLDELFALNDT